MRKPIVAGNWKMNGDRTHVQSLLDEIKEHALTVSDVELIVFPPFVYLEQTQKTLQDSDILWGGQNVSEHEAGAFTGEISAAMLNDWGCRYVLVGHSERRALYHEAGDEVARKFVAVVKKGLRPIFCVGETLEEREAEQTQKIIAQQLQAVLSITTPLQWREAVIAYEPVWAIGTGHTATPEQAQAVHQFIRETLAGMDKAVAEATRILYGGSVKPDNAEALFVMNDIDGGLVGGASLKAESFMAIAQSI